MRKNKLISHSSKPLLKVNNPNISKNKLQLPTSFNSLQKFSPNNNLSNEKKFLSPRTFGLSKKVSFQAAKSSEVTTNHKLRQKKLTSLKFVFVCENKSLIKKLELFGVQSQQVIYVDPKANELKDISNLDKIIILSTLQEFNSIYVSLITSVSINVSHNDKSLKEKILWFIVCDAINSKNIQSSFKETYKNVHFVFHDSIFSLVNLVNLTINGVIKWETSKNKFQISTPKTSPLSNSNPQIYQFQEIVHLNLSKNNQYQIDEKNLVNGFFCIRQKELEMSANKWRDLKVNTLYICNKKQYQQFFLIKCHQNTNHNQSKSHIKPILYLNYLLQLNSEIPFRQLLKVIMVSKSYILLHLTQNLQQEFNTLTPTKDPYRILKRESQLLTQIENSSHSIFSDSQNAKELQKISFNRQQIFKIMINFKSRSLSSQQFVFLILKKSHLSLIQKDIDTFDLGTYNHRVVSLLLNEQIPSINFINNFKGFCVQLNISTPLFFMVSQIQQDQAKSLFEQIYFQDVLILSKLKAQLSHKVQIKKVFSGSSLKQISKKISIYGIQSNKIHPSNLFISQLCYFLGLDIKMISQKQIAFSPSLHPIKDEIQQTKNKINILFGKINSQNEKNQIFRSFLVVYLPKMEKISMQKLVTTITKAYEKYFYLIDSQNLPRNQSNLQLSLYIFNIPNLQLTQNVQLETSQTVKHFGLNQFQECIKNAGLSSRLKRSMKRSFYFIFQMNEFEQEYEALIDNARMKNDCEIEIYLKYGQQFIHRPKNGKYKFIKSNQLKIQIKVLIENCKTNQKYYQLPEQKQKQTIEEINKMINSESIIQQSPKKIDSFLMTPIKVEQKSTYQAQNSFIQSMIQQNDQQLNQSLNSVSYFNTIVQGKNQTCRFNRDFKLYVFVHKTMPLKCLINRNQADYQILTYNTPNQPLLMAPYLNQNQLVVVLKKKSQKSVTQLIKSNSIVKSIQSSNKSCKTSSNAQKVTKNFKIIELKEMSENQVTKVIDSLICKLKLKKIQSQQSNKFLNQIPLIIYECQQPQTTQIRNKLKKIRSLVSFQNQIETKSKDLIFQTPLKQKSKFNDTNKSNYTSEEQISSQYFVKSSVKKKKIQTIANKSQKDERFSQQILSMSLSKNDAQEEYFSKKSSQFNQPIQPQQIENYQDFMKRFKAKAPLFGKYFLTIGEIDLMRVTYENQQRLGKICEQIGIRFYYFGSKKGYQSLKIKLKLNLINLSQIQSPKQLLLKYFNPYIRIIEKGTTTSNLKLLIGNSLILQRLLQEEREKSKIPQRLWNVSNRSQKSLSNRTIKSGSGSKTNNLSNSNLSSLSSLKTNCDNEYYDKQTPSKINPTLNYYYSKQLIKERPLNTHMNLLYVVGSSGIRDLIKKQKTTFQKVKVNEYFTCVQDLMTILWENGEKKYFMVVLMTNQQMQDLVTNILFATDAGINLQDVIILSAKQSISNESGNQTADYLKLLLTKDKQIDSSVLQRELKYFEQTIEYIQKKIQYQVADIIEAQNLLNKNSFENMLMQQISMQERQLMSKIYEQHFRHKKQKLCVIICFVEDFEYLQPLIDSIVYKKQSQHSIKLTLQKAHSIEEALNLNTKLMIPRCLIVPSEWWYLKITNGIMIDYNLQHFQRKLAIFLNNILNQFIRKHKFSLGKTQINH